MSAQFTDKSNKTTVKPSDLNTSKNSIEAKLPDARGAFADLRLNSRAVSSSTDTFNDLNLTLLTGFKPEELKEFESLVKKPTDFESLISENVSRYKIESA
jgi:hypothetical protein